MSEDPDLQDVLRDSVTEHLYRVCWRAGEYVWLIGMTGEGDWPVRHMREDLRGARVLTKAPAGEGKSTECSNPRAALATYERFQLVLDNIPRLLTPRGRSEAYSELRVTDKKLSKRTFYKVVRKWLVGGSVVSGLGRPSKPKAKAVPPSLPELSYADAVKQVRGQAQRLMSEPKPEVAAIDHTRSGRPRKNKRVKPRTRYRRCPATMRVFWHFFEVKKKTRGLSVEGAYKQMREEVFAERGPTNQLILFPDWVIPSLGTFSLAYYSLVPHRKRRAALTGEHDFDLNQRAKLGQSISAAYMAGLVGELDATVWNVNLVSEDEVPWDIGPPIVFRIRCKDSGELLGLAIGIESASWNEAATAIDNCLEDKQAYCARYGVQISPDDWKVRGVTARINADCGETYNSKPDRFIFHTGVTIVNLPKARGDLKGGVESDFFRIQVALNGLTPGALIKQYEETHQMKWRVKGSYTLRQFTEIVIREELKQMRTPRPQVLLEPGMTSGGADTSPYSVWKWLEKNNGCALRILDRTSTRKHLLDTAKGTLTDAGLEFKGLLYLSEGSIASDLFSKMRLRGFKSVCVAFDHRLVDTIYLLDGDPKGECRYEEYQLNVHRMDQRKYAGRTFREVTLIMERQAQNDAAAAEANLAREREHTQAQKAISDESSARVQGARGALGITVADLKANQHAARAAEKDRLGPERALVPKIEVAPEDALPQPLQVATRPVRHPPPEGKRARQLRQMELQAAAMKDRSQA